MQSGRRLGPAQPGSALLVGTLMARTGRRPGESGTQQAILDAARAAFTETGYDGATMRGIARAAGVDPALVHHYFGTKEDLFVAAMQLPFDPAVIIPALLAPGIDGLGERILRLFLSIWDSPERVSPFIALLRGAMTHETSAHRAGIRTLHPADRTARVDRDRADRGRRRANHPALLHR